MYTCGILYSSSKGLNRVDTVCTVLGNLRYLHPNVTSSHRHLTGLSSHQLSIRKDISLRSLLYYYSASRRSHPRGVPN